MESLRWCRKEEYHRCAWSDRLTSESLHQHLHAYVLMFLRTKCKECSLTTYYLPRVMCVLVIVSFSPFFLLLLSSDNTLWRLTVKVWWWVPGYIHMSHTHTRKHTEERLWVSAKTTHLYWCVFVETIWFEWVATLPVIHRENFKSTTLGTFWNVKYPYAQFPFVIKLQLQTHR